jgi:hypothetical protein
MAGNVEIQIKPTGLSQRNLVDVLYMIVAAIQGICKKLDADGGVTLETYEDNCFKAIFNGYIEDSRGNSVMNRAYVSPNYTKDHDFYHITPTGLSDKAFNSLLYQIFDMVETLTEQCDTDGLGDSNYEALVYTAHYLWMVTNHEGNTLGVGSTYWFNPGGGRGDQKELVDLLAMIVHSFDTFTKKLDADGTVTDTTYHALWDTAVFLLKIEDSKGNAYGNALTTFMP